MNKKNIFSTFLFIVSTILAAVAVVTKRWVESDFYGYTTFGLSDMCFRLKDYRAHFQHDEMCQSLLDAAPIWKWTLGFASIGIILVVLTVITMVTSIWKPEAESSAKWSSYIARMVLFFGITIITFPFGFSMEHIRAANYHLPQNYALGSSYYCFIGSICTLFVAMVLVNVRSLDLMRHPTRMLRNMFER